MKELKIYVVVVSHKNKNIMERKMINVYLGQMKLGASQKNFN